MVDFTPKEPIKDEEFKQFDQSLDEKSYQTVDSAPEAYISMLQDAAGNQAVNKLVQSIDSDKLVADVVPSSVHQVLHSSGQPLDRHTRASMESHFNYDFSQVLIHTGTQAIKSARAIGARAYTVGRNIVFGDKQYSPKTSKGKQLLAHELVHIVQKRIRNTTLGEIPFVRQNHSAENEAQQLASLSSSSQIAHPRQSIPANTINCAPEGGPTISPTDPSLRRINDIDQRALPNAKESVRAGTYKPVSILKYNPGPGTVKVVTDGVHRVQAAIELSLPKIRYIEVTEAQVRAEFNRRGLSFDDWMQRNLKPFGSPPRAGGVGGGRPGGGRPRPRRGGGGGTPSSSGGKNPIVSGGREVKPPRQQQSGSEQQQHKGEQTKSKDFRTKGKVIHTDRLGRKPSRPRSTIGTGRTSRFRPKGAGLTQVLPSAMNAFQDRMIRHRVATEMLSKWSTLEKWRKNYPKHVIIAVVSLQEWEHPNDAGMVARAVNYVSFFHGPTQQAAEAKAAKALKSGVPKNWREIGPFIGVIQPGENLNNAKEKVEDQECFIATACYKSPLAPEVQLLREFRDAVLQHSYLGRAFIELYYQTSPPIADFLRKHEYLRVFVRQTILVAIVAFVRWSAHWWKQ